MTRIVEEGREPPGFSLLGGPLHRLGRRLGLVRGATNSAPLGLALGALPWAVLVVLALVEGVGDRLFSLSVIGVHVRLLAVIPLFFLCEAWLDPRTTMFVSMITRAKIVPGDARPGLDSAVARAARWRDSWLPEAACLVVAVLLSVIPTQLHLSGTTAALDPGRATGGAALAGAWYWGVCLPLFRFLVVRWLWRLGLWVCFLWRVSRLDLHLVPTHPDGAGGLGYLEVVHAHLIPLALALSVVQAASLAEEISSGRVAFEAAYPALAFVLVMNVALFVGPLFVFIPRLWACRADGLSEYGRFAERYVSGFDRKWLHAETPPGEPLLGTSDIQSLADLANSVNLVLRMRMVPTSPLLLRELALVSVLPMLPLYLLKYPVAQLAEKFFAKLAGL